MSRNLLIVMMLALLAQTPILAGEMQIGDGRIDGARIAGYKLTWHQCGFQDGRWQDAGDLTEEVLAVDEATLRLRQIAERPDGTVVTSDVYFQRPSFAPQRMETEVTSGSMRVAHVERTLDADGYTGLMIQGEEQRELEGVIGSDMLHGGAMGLPLATMEYQSEPLEFLASMMSFDATYEVTATWAGRENIDFDGQTIESWLIDVEWHHRESGDVYPPGPDASGGRYWVVQDPPHGFPYVPKYKTDTYVVEFIEDDCSD